MAPAPAPAQPELADYAFLSDCRSAALVSRDGSLDWWCAPRVDSPSVFGRLLGPEAGHWSVRPVGQARSEREYVAGSLVLRTRWTTPAGVVTVTDALALEPGARGHEIGRESPGSLLRRVEGVQGRVRVAVEVAPRPEYGLTLPRWRREGDRWVVPAGPVSLSLEGGPGDPVRLEHDGGTLRGELEVAAGDVVELRLGQLPTYGASGVVPVVGALDDTVAAWRSWAGQHSAYDGEYAEEVHASTLVLQGLTYQRSGAVVAAATTSLPENPRGGWNWDYRFAWVRDASLTMRALWVSACPDEADRFFRWLARSMGHLGPQPLQIVFGVEGERDLSERELSHLPGYRGNSPVRVGNGAWRQRQLDVLGEVLDAALQLDEQLGDLDGELQEFLAGLADQAAELWDTDDSGMWEARDTERPYVSSKVMCWVALDRAVRLADRLGDAAHVAAWERARDEVRQTVLDRAWHPGVGAYTGAFGSDHLDVSVLLMPLVGFLPADDERMLATIHAVRDALAGGDGFAARWAGDSHAFLISSFWLVECLALAGELDEARSLFERLLAARNDLGLMAEEYDARSGRLVGNLPQAFSHVGLVNAAWRIDQAARGRW